MAVKLVFLGRLEDLAGQSEIEVPVAPLATIIAQLERKLADAVKGPRVRVAINGALVAPGGNAAVADGDEVAFLPAVSGG